MIMNGKMRQTRRWSDGRNKIQQALLAKRFVNSRGCWVWKGGVVTDGYGRIRVSGRSLGVHRAAFWAFKRKWPGKKLVLHKCDNPPCFNPEHLMLGTALENVKQAFERGGRKPAGYKKVCLRGHRFTESNTYLYRGIKQCKKCKVVRRKEHHERTGIWV